MKIGSHLTITKGLDKAAELAAQIGADVFQYFTRNPRGGRARQIKEDEIAKWHEARKEKGIFLIIGHLPYTVNLAACDPRQLEFAEMVVREDLQRVNAIGGEIIVSHPGRHDGDRSGALKRVVALLEPILKTFQDGETVFCLETMALQGKELGSLDDIAEMIKELASGNVGVCLDTAHLFGAGWDLRTADGCDRLVEQLEQKIGLERIKCMHLNDSRAPLGSHKDRHANIGGGELGYDGIAAVVKHPFLGKLPLVLETPVNDYHDYEPEIAMVRSMIE